MQEELFATHSMVKVGTLTQGFLAILTAALLVVSGQILTEQSSPMVEDLPEFVEGIPGLPDPDSQRITSKFLPGSESWKSWQNRTSSTKKGRKKSRTPLSGFLTSLHDLVQKPDQSRVRVAYFGDSMIEGDRITQSLRNDMQDMFGGSGVGFVPIVYAYYGDRRTIWHRFSNDWEDYNFMKPRRSDAHYGISGEYFLTRNKSNRGRTWVRYKGSDEYPRTQIFEQVYLYYGTKEDGSNSDQDYYVVSNTQDQKDTAFLAGDRVVNGVALSNEPTEDIKLNFNIPGDMPVFGMSFESESGIFVDNFSARGHSGMNLVDIPGENLKAFHELLDYDLIILQFGLNVVSPNRRNFSSYEKGMKKVVEHFQKHCPGVDILLVSVSDKSTRIKGVLQTDPSVPLIVDTQRRVAETTGTGFLNLYQSMGGRNSMIQWVKAKPSLARNDYAHPNRRGAVKVGEIVKDYLLKEYEHEYGPLKKEKEDNTFASIFPYAPSHN
ncbi:MAG: hypothetical protein AAFW00_05415 [Bacteroidota bacterium]